MNHTPVTSRKEIRRSYLSRPGTLYPSMEPAGRKIIFGFSYVQNIGKGAHTQVWFPPTLEEKIADRLLSGDDFILDEFCVDWAAVRQFELLQESGNEDILPLDVSNFRMAFKLLRRHMRAGGMRVTVITMGRYENAKDRDDLQILDKRLQTTIAEFISMLFLEEQSAAASADFERLAKSGQWDFSQALPHVAITLGAGPLFKPTKSVQAETRFFQLLEMLPPQQIRHDVAIGLQLPEHQARSQWIYMAPMENKFFAFQTALSTVFRGFDGLSVHQLNGHAGPCKDMTMQTMTHMRGYGDHMQANRRQHLVDSALYMRDLMRVAPQAA